MTQSRTASLASALVAGMLVLASWTSTLSIPSSHAATVEAAAHVILA